MNVLNENKFKNTSSGSTQLRGWSKDILFGISLLFAFVIPVVTATSIVQLNFDELVARSQLVFEGVVVSSEPRWNGNRTEISTLVEFKVNDVIKGNVDGSSISLSFAGGQMGQDNTLFQAMIYPKVGETGIYFVERTDIEMVNPLLGWSQGHFVIDNGKMMTNQNRKVMGLDTLSTSQRSQFSLSDGEIRGLRSAETNKQDQDVGVNVAEFKEMIREQLQ